MQVTREQFIAEINRRQPDERPRGSGFEARGAQMTWDRAMKLYRRLQAGGMPTTRETVGYFGAGARFVEEVNA